jgi:hypothetical protein
MGNWDHALTVNKSELLRQLKGDEPVLIYSLSDLTDHAIVPNLEQTNTNIKDWFSLASLPWVEKKSFIIIAEKMVSCARTSKEIRRIFLIEKIWSDRGHGEHSDTIIKAMNRQNRIAHKAYIEVLYYYQNHLKEDAMIYPPLKVMMMKKALLTSNSLEAFLNSSTAARWETAVKMSLQKIDWPIEKWRDIVNSSVPKKFKTIALQRIEKIKKTGSTSKYQTKHNF